MDEISFRIRPYLKRELAELYFPDTVNARSAVANLRKHSITFTFLKIKKMSF